MIGEHIIVHWKRDNTRQLTVQCCRSRADELEVESAPAQQRNNARDTAEQEIAADRISYREPHTVCGGNDTAKLAHRPDTKKKRYLTCYCCPEYEAAMKTLMRVDTACEQRDRHFSRAREGEVACERETSPHRQQNALW